MASAITGGVGNGKLLLNSRGGSGTPTDPAGLFEFCVSSATLLATPESRVTNLESNQNCPTASTTIAGSNHSKTRVRRVMRFPILCVLRRNLRRARFESNSVRPKPAASKQSRHRAYLGLPRHPKSNSSGFLWAARAWGARARLKAI